MSKKTRHVLANMGKVIAIPLAVYVFCEAIAYFVIGEHLIANMLALSVFAKNVCILTLAAFAMSLNMSTGRMDFSLGGQQLIACVIGGNIAIQLGLGTWGVIAMSTIFGAVAGLIVGVLFVTLRMPSMVLGIGMAMIYECFAFAYSSTGVQYFGNPELSGISNVPMQLIIVILVVIIFVILYDYTKFGYHYRAIRGNQKIAMSKGINVFKNCITSYVMAGALISLSGVFATSYTGILESTLGTATIQVSFSALMPVVFAMHMPKWSSFSIALLVTSISTRLISVLLTSLQLSSSAIVVINYMLIFSFLILMGGLRSRHLTLLRKKRVEQAISLLN